MDHFTICLHEKRAKLICLTTVGETILRHLLRYHLNPDPAANTDEDLANLFKGVGVDTIEKTLTSLNYPCNIPKIYKSPTGEFQDEIVIDNLDITPLGEIIRKIHTLKCIQAGVNLGNCPHGLHGNHCCGTCNHNCVGCNDRKCKRCKLLENKCRDCDKTKEECLNMKRIHCSSCQRCHFCLKQNPTCIGYKLDENANVIRGELRNTAMHLTNNECMDLNFTFPGVSDCTVWRDVWMKFRKSIKFISKELFNLNYLDEAEKINISKKIEDIALNDKVLYWQQFQDRTETLFKASRNYDDLKDCVTLSKADLVVVGNIFSVVRQQVARTIFNVKLETDFWWKLSRKMPWCNDRRFSDDVLENLLTHIFYEEMVIHSGPDNFKVKVSRNSPLKFGWSCLKFDLVVSFEHGSLPECYESRTSPERKKLCETIALELRRMFPHLAIHNLDLIIKCLIIRFELRRNDGCAIPLPQKTEIIRVLTDTANNRHSSLQKLLNSNGIKPSTIDVQFAERECNPTYSIDVMADVTVSENADIAPMKMAITKALNQSMEFLDQSEKVAEVSTTVSTKQMKGKETKYGSDNKTQTKNMATSSEESSSSLPSEVGNSPSQNQLLRFITLGLPNSYKDEARLDKNIKLIETNIENVRQMIQEGQGAQIVDLLIEYSSQARCAKQGYILLSLAVCISGGDLNLKETIFKAVNQICRIPTQLFMLLQLMYCILDSVDALAILKTFGIYHDSTKEKQINLRKNRGSSKRSNSKKKNRSNSTEEGSEQTSSSKENDDALQSEEHLTGKDTTKETSMTRATVEKSLKPSQFVSKNRKLLTAWYADGEKTSTSLLYLMTKYQNRYKWDHKLFFRYGHIRIKTDDADEKFRKDVVVTFCLSGYDKAIAMFGQAQKGDFKRDILNERESRIHSFIEALNDVKKIPNVLNEENVNTIIEIIERNKRMQGVPRIGSGILTYALPGTAPPLETVPVRSRLHIAMEHLPTAFMNSKHVWQALLEDLPLTTFISNITRISNLGLFDRDIEFGDVNFEIFSDRFLTDKNIQGAMLHPFKILTSLWMYTQGNTRTQSPDEEQNTKICKVLSNAFFKSFNNDQCKSAKQNFIIYIDNSEEMNEKEFLGFRCNISPAMAAVAMTMKINEPNCIIFVGDNDFKKVKKDSLVDTMVAVDQLTKSTDLSFPFTYATDAKQDEKPTDVFIIFTKDTSGAEPYSSFKRYKQTTGQSNTKLIICAMESCSSMMDEPEEDVKIINGGDSHFLKEIYNFIQD